MIRPSDIHSVSTFTRNAKKLIQQVKQTKKPIAITVNGEAEVIILDALEYERLTEFTRSAWIDMELERGFRQIAEGKTVSLEELEKEVDEILGL